ncbi:hypothetical protein [Bradyrhizobium sp.]
MGQRCEWAYDAGIDLGLSSYAFSIRNNTSGLSNAGAARDHLVQLGITDVFDPSKLFSEQDVVKVREHVPEQLNPVDGRLTQVYQLGLHLGLAWGQSSASQSDWKVAAVLAKRGFSQGHDDVLNFKIEYLIRASLDAMIQNMGDSINLAAYDPQLTNRVSQLTLMIRQQIAQEPSVP